MASLFRAYTRMMGRSPFVTQCVSCGILVGTGDVIAQKVVEKQSSLNLTRTAKFAAFGMFYVGPAITIWYRFLDRKFGARQLLLKPWQKVACDQLFFSPQVNLFALPLLGCMNQKNWDEIKQSVRENYVDIMIANYKIWPMAQMVNFYFVPLDYRVIFASCFSIFWNTYYTWKMGEK